MINLGFTNSFTDQVYLATCKIPKGKVATYSDIARLIGRPNASRAVGNALHRNPYEGIIPCHRVVNSQGKLACHFGFGGSREQASRLRQEGVEVQDEKVDLKIYQWKPKQNAHLRSRQNPKSVL